jgi:hypothetical protein
VAEDAALLSLRTGRQRIYLELKKHSAVSRKEAGGMKAEWNSGCSHFYNQKSSPPVIRLMTESFFPLERFHGGADHVHESDT